MNIRLASYNGLTTVRRRDKALTVSKKLKLFSVKVIPKGIQK